MRKILFIGWKDLTVIFRDRAALILMLAAPFALTLGMGLVTGRFSGGDTTGIQDVPVILINQDDGALGRALVDVFASPELSGLLAPTTGGDPEAARAQVAANEVAGAVIIPAGFSDSIIPRTAAAAAASAVVPIQVILSPARPLSGGIIQSVVDAFISRVETGRVSSLVAINELLAHGLVQPADIGAAAQAMGARLLAQGDSAPRIALAASQDRSAPQPQEFDPLAVLAPGMALLFLMYTVSLGGRSLLAEQREGTLARLLTSPTGAGQALAGKMLGAFLIGLAQMTILIGSSTLLFGLRWGDPLALAPLIIAAVTAATGWGMLLAAVARQPGQVSGLGMALALLFGLLGGSFFGGAAPQGPLALLARLTPNRWAQDGFTRLAQGGTLSDLLPMIAALLVMALALLVIAILIFRRKGLLSR
jgi:ABC-2 type transport system permease protein